MANTTVYPQLSFTDGEDFNADVLNAATSCLDLRLRAVEGLNASYQDAINTLNKYGLERLNDALQPVYDSLTKFAALGAIFTTTSTSASDLTVGVKTFVVDPQQRQAFAPAAYLQVRSLDDPSLALYGPTQSYDESTGVLTMLVTQVAGTTATPIKSWRISAAATPDFVNTAHQVGAYTQAEVDQKIAQAAGAIDLTGLFPVSGGHITGDLTLDKGTLNLGPGQGTGAVAWKISSWINGALYVQHPDGTDSFIFKPDGSFTIPQVGDLKSYIDQGLRADGVQSLTDQQKAQLAANLGLKLPLGQCQFILSSATTCSLVPRNGNQILINGALRTIPAAGVQLTNAGLSLNALYYVYAYWTGSSIALVASTNAPVQDPTYGILTPSGTPSYTLVGMVYTVNLGNGTVFADQPDYRCVASWFNRTRKELNIAASSGSTGTGFVEFGTRSYFLNWGEDRVDVGVIGYCYPGTYDNVFWYMAIDGTQISYAPGPAIDTNHGCPVSEWMSYYAGMGIHYHQLFGRGGGYNITMTHQKVGAVII